MGNTFVSYDEDPNPQLPKPETVQLPHSTTPGTVAEVASRGRLMRETPNEGCLWLDPILAAYRVSSNNRLMLSTFGFRI